MKKMGLSEALKAIHVACKTANRFSFVVGAGISCPEVPLSSKIIEELKGNHKIKKLKSIENLKPMKQYSDIISMVLPDPGTRWEYFKEKVENKKISISNLLLAQLLAMKNLPKIVLTPNFDDFLTRSLSLLQIPHILMDHPKTIIDRYDESRDEIQIIHIHGSYKYYDMCNEEAEILRNTGAISPTVQKIFQKFSPIVIGYSGWEDDSIMTGLKLLLDGIPKLNFSIYWFCFDEKSLNSLPDWLKIHQSVVFVVPEEGKAIRKVQASEVDGSWEIIEKIPDELSSEEVIKALLKEFKLKENKCFSNLLKDYETFLKKSLPGKNIQGIFSYGHIIREIEVAQLSLAEYNARMNSEIESLKHLLNNDNHVSILSKAIDISHFNLNPSQIDDFLHILSSMNLMKNLKINPAEIIPGIGELFENLTKENEYYFKIQVNQLKAAVVKAEMFGKLNLLEEEMSIYEFIITNFEIKNFTGSMKCIRSIKKNIVRGISKLKSTEEKLRFLDLFLDRYSSSDSPGIQIYVAITYYEKGTLLKEQSRLDEAIEAFEKIDLYKNFHYRYLRVCLAKSWLDRGWIFKQKDEIKKSNDAFEKIGKDFGNSEYVALKQIVEEAMEAKESPFPIEVKAISYSEAISDRWYSDNPVNEESLNHDLNELEKIIDSLDIDEVEGTRILDKIIAANLGSIINPGIQIIHVKALLKKAEMLRISRDHGKALELCDEIERYFGLSEDHAIQDLVIESLYKKIDMFPVGADAETSETYNKLSLKYAKRGDKELCLTAIENALYYGMPCSEVRYNSFLADFFKDDDRFEKLVEKYEQIEKEDRETLE